jgi:hypothetical protein
MNHKKVPFIALLITALVGFLMSLIVFRWDEGSSPILYWGIMPGLPFVLISLWALQNRTSASLGNLMGANACCMLVTLLAYGSIYYFAVFSYSGGGANIGLGLLLLPLPIYYLIAAIVGWRVGGNFKNGT